MRRPLARTDRLRAAVAGILLACLAMPAAHAQEPAPDARMLTLGPWPPASPPADAAGRAAAALGEQLFFSPRLGDGGGVRCASCHEPWRRYTDGRPRALGRAEGARNTPTLLDVAQHRRFGWDGARDELASQALRPLADPLEMPAGARHVATLLRDDPALAARYAAAFGTPPQADEEAVLRAAGRALAAYVATLASGRTPFDDWRDAVAADPRARAPSAAAGRGLALFVGRGGCVACHGGPGFSDDDFHVSLVRSTRPDGRPDDGRAGLAPNSFRTPGLRDVAATAPYMHDGSVASLCDALAPHALGQPGPLGVAERRDLVAFLETLQSGPAPAAEGARSCRP